MQTSAALNTTATQVRTATVPWPAIGVFIFGLVLLYCVGFSTVTQAHNAAHDTRHANGFPCH